jgi:hypothetical protein
LRAFCPELGGDTARRIKASRLLRAGLDPNRVHAVALVAHERIGLRRRLSEAFGGQREEAPRERRAAKAGGRAQGRALELVPLDGIERSPVRDEHAVERLEREVPERVQIERSVAQAARSQHYAEGGAHRALDEFGRSKDESKPVVVHVEFILSHQDVSFVAQRTRFAHVPGR